MSFLLSGEAAGSERLGDYQCIKYLLRIEFEPGAVLTLGSDIKTIIARPQASPLVQKACTEMVLTIGSLRKLTAHLNRSGKSRTYAPISPTPNSKPRDGETDYLSLKGWAASWERWHCSPA